jgi:predicted Zn-dependent peptidase
MHRVALRLVAEPAAPLVAFAIVIVVTLAGGCATAERAKGSEQAAGRATSTGPAENAARPTREVLANGVTLIVREHRASDVVAIQLWFKVGGRDEALDELGLSHYLEHMLFKGTATRPPGSIDRLIEGFGGQSNAFTAYDYTHYDIVLPAEHVRAGLELLADIGVNASFPEAELDAERKVVLEEMNLLEDEPERFMQRRLSEVAFRAHPYGRPLLGTRELIQALTRDRLDRYYKKHYVPANMTVVVVGAVTHAQVRPLVEATFGRLRGPAAARAQVPTAGPLTEKIAADVARPEKQAYLGLAWKVASLASDDIFAIDLLTTILGDSPSSRLNLQVRERDRLVFTIEAGYGAWEKGGLVTVTARLDPGNLDRAERSILDVLRRVRADGVSEAELQRAIITTESNYAFDTETAEGLAKAYGQADTTWTLEKELGYLDRVRQVTAAEVQAAARKYFGDDYARVRFVPGDGSR